jgi:hypothetical protein
VKRATRKHRRAAPEKTTPTTTPAPASPAPSTAPSPSIEKVKLHAHLDPTYTRNPLNPFEVSFAYSASASEQTFSAQSVALGAEEPAPLPAGVLAFYSDGKLECAINVGGAVAGSQCPVTYTALGEHRVTTILSSDELENATETEVVNIAPLATQTTLSVSYSPIAEPAEAEPASGVWWIGDLTISLAASPQGRTPVMGCGEGLAGEVTVGGCYQLTTAALEHVYANETGSCSAPEMGKVSIGQSPASRGAHLEAAQLETGEFHLRASIAAGGGYSASEATAPIQFSPEVTFPPDC